MTSERRLGAISLAMSGGGTRAAGFHLGSLSYLDRVGLLKDVTITSSASGGSIVNSTYAMACARGWDFQTYFLWMLEKLRYGEMIDWVLREMADGTPRSLSQRRSMVTALAEVYDRHFFQGFKFGELIDKKPGHLEEVVINATDFRTGLGFRFQRHDPMGNGRTNIEPAQMRHARLADVMAASSCLPGGLEPFFFPEDFVWEGDDAKRAALSIQARLRTLGVDAIPLMDGGIYDNQGLESLMLAASRGFGTSEDSALLAGERLAEHGDDSQKRLYDFDLLFQRIATGKAAQSPPGLVIVSDVPLDADPVYRGGYAPGDRRPLPTLPPPGDRGPTLGAVQLWWRVLAGLSLASGVAILIHLAGFLSGQRRFGFDGAADDILLYAVPLLLTASAFGALMWLRSQFRSAMAVVDDVLATEGVHSASAARAHDAWGFLKHLRLAQVIYLARLRASSVVSLANDIFFIRTRVLSYMLLYMMEGWRKRLITNEIYDVAHASGPDAPQPTEGMINVADSAAQLPTAFWFERPEDLPHLVASGQMTMCFNLISYLRRQRRLNPEEFTPAMADLLNQAEADWMEFASDPHVFVPKPIRPSVLLAAQHQAQAQQ